MPRAFLRERNMTRSGSVGPRQWSDGSRPVLAPRRLSSVSFVLRATPQDALAIAQVHVSSWQMAYQGLLPHDYLAAQRVDHRCTYWTRELTTPSSPDSAVWIARDGDAVVGFASVGPCRDHDRHHPGQWELYALYVVAEHWGNGVGRNLLDHALSLSSSGDDSWSLWVLADNDRAMRFYRHHGFTVDGTERVRSRGGQHLIERRLVRAPGWKP